MQKSTLSLLVAVLMISVLAIPRQTVYAQVSIPADINKTFTPISIDPGGTSRLRVTIFNPNDFELTNASWTDNLPSQITVIGTVSNTCGGSVTANAGSSTISLSGGTVPAQAGSTPGSCTVTVDVTSSSPGNWINIIPAGELSSTGPAGVNITNTSEARITLNVSGTGTPTVSKSFRPTNIWAGGTSQLTINIANNANIALTGASITDSLPGGVFLANPVAEQLSGCGGTASVSATPGGGTVTLNNGTIAAGSTCTITVNVTGDVQGRYTNTIPAGSLGNNQGLTNATAATARLTIREVGLTKQFLDSTIQPGQTTTLTITLQNPRSTPYTGVNVTDPLPALMVPVPGTESTTCGGTVAATATSLTLTGGTIPAGTPAAPGTCTISVQVTVPAGTPSQQIPNTIPTTGLTTAQGIGLLTPVTANLTVVGTEVAGSKEFTPATISAGGNSRLRIRVRAPSDTNLTNFAITDNLPVGLTISNSTPAAQSANCIGGTINAPTGGTTFSWTGGTINAGQECIIDVWVTSILPTAAGTPYTNTIPPNQITNDQNRQPTNAFTDTLAVTGGGNLAISLVKGFDPPGVFGGASSTMSVELINPGSVALTGITFTDNMPSGMILANPVNFNVGTCGGTLTGTPGSGSFSFSGGSLPPQGRCVLTLSATMNVNGNLINTIDAQAVTTDQGITNPDATSATLTNQPGASVNKLFSPNPIPAGSFSLLTITIANTGTIELIGMRLSDSLPPGLVIASGSAPAPVNNCGGTLTAVAGTQLIQLVDGTLAGSSSCTMVIAITGSNPGDYQNTIPAGGLIADPNTRNTSPATATLTITGAPVAGGGGGGGGGRQDDDEPARPARTNAFLIPVTGFKANVLTDLSNVPMENYTATGDVTLEIPSLGVKIPVVGVPRKNDTWNVAWLGDQAGWLEGSAFPSWNGNSVLTGHVYSANGLPGPFINLKNLKFGDKVVVYAFGQKFTFDVQTNEIVNPNDRSVMKHEEKPWLTLVTCRDYDEKTDTYRQRVVVRAVLVDVRPIK